MTTNKTTPTQSRADRAAALLDLTISELTKRVSAGEVSAGTLREVLALARASGVDFAREDQLMSASAQRNKSGFDLSCLDDLDPALLEML